MTDKIRLYKMLSQYTSILSAVEKDYKPFVPKEIERQIAEVYIKVYPNNHLRDWSCPACSLHNWKLFNKFYKNYNKSNETKS